MIGTCSKSGFAGIYQRLFIADVVFDKGQIPIKHLLLPGKQFLYPVGDPNNTG